MVDEHWAAHLVKPGVEVKVTRGGRVHRAAVARRWELLRVAIDEMEPETHFAFYDLALQIGVGEASVCSMLGVMREDGVVAHAKGKGMWVKRGREGRNRGRSRATSGR